MTSAENSVSEPPNLNLFWGEYPQAPYKARAFGTCDSACPPPPFLYKKPTYGPEITLTLEVISISICYLRNTALMVLLWLQQQNQL